MGAPKFHSLRELAAGLPCASRRGLVERFDSTIGAGSVTMPFGGKTQRTPAQSMTALLPVLPGQETEQASVMAYGCDPERMSVDPFSGAMDAVVTSLTKLVAAGADYKKAYLTLQEFFEKLRTEPERWGKPFAALLGALEQAELFSQVSSIHLEATQLTVRYLERFDVKMRINADFSYSLRLMQAVRKELEAQGSTEIRGSMDLTQKEQDAVFSPEK